MSRAVGVVGLGIMGGAIARSLAAANYRVLGFDLDHKRRNELAQEGVHPAESLAELVDCTDTLLTSLPDSGAVRVTMHAISTAAHARKTVIETSTLALRDKLDVKQILNLRDHVVLDCPISGTGAQAKTKDLVIYASGDSTKISELERFFRSFARQVYDVGEFGNGTRVKLVANLLVAIHNVATAEAMVLAARAGLDLNKTIEWISAGSGSSRIFEKRAPLMAENKYMPATMKLSVWQKDLNIISAFAAELQSPTPLLNAALPVYDEAMATRSEKEDTASVCAVLEGMAGGIVR